MSFLRKSILVSGGEMIGVVLVFILGILYSRVLGPDGVGQYRLFQTTAVLVVAVAAMGIGNASIYFLKNRNVPINLVTTNIVKFIVVVGLVLSGGMAFAFLGWRWYFGYISVPVAIIFALGTGAMLGMALLRHILVAKLEAKRIVLVSLTRSSVLLGGGCLLAVLGWLNPQAAILVLAMAMCAGFALSVIYVRGHIDLSSAFDWGLFGETLVYGLKLAAANVLYLMSFELSVILLRYLTPEEFEPVGLYTRAATISTLIVIVPRMVGPLLYAKLSSVTGLVRRHQAEMAIRLSITYGVLAAVPVVLLGKHVIWVLYGEKFLAAQEALRILVPSTIFVAIFIVCSSVLAGDGKAVITAYISAATVTIIFVMTYLLVPSLGIRGAALGALSGNAFAALGTFAVCCMLYGLNPLRCVFMRLSDLKYARQALKR